MRIGALGFGFGSLGLADLLRAEAQAGVGSSTKSLINIHLSGGPPHLDLWDLKPDAPAEYRGEFYPIKTNVPGLEICELMPELAKIGEKFAVIRSLVGSVNEHSPNTTQTGYPQNAFRGVGGAPAIGSVMAKLQGFHHGVAPFVTDGFDLSPGYLGPRYRPFSASGARDLLTLGHIKPDQLTERVDLLRSVDTLRREADASGQFEAADTFMQQAADVVLSGRMAQALDVSQEPAETIERYCGDGKDMGRMGKKLLLARRLVEAGVRCVAISWGGWDTHGDNFNQMRRQLPAMDRALAALLQDLHDRGRDGDVTVAVWGEFGRTPRVNATAGRDHWPQLGGVFLAGGGMRLGQAIGISDRVAADVVERPVHIHEVLATLYHNVGIPPQSTQIIDPAGRPRYLLDRREPIAELV